MKFIYTYIILFQFAVNGQDLKNDPAAQIISEEFIKSSGITSISEIINLADKWNMITIDGASNFFTSNNLSVYQRQNVIIMLDGQEINIGIFDVQNLNLLPISLDQIDYVELINTPQIYIGEFAQNGLIHFHTKKPLKGLSLQGSHIIGDETGDPGPLIFTENKSANVDKLAQFFSTNINTAGENWFMKGSLKHEETFKTDPAILNRISSLNFGDNKTRLISYYFNLGINKFNGEQQLIAGITTGDDYFFFNPHGNEIPVKLQFKHFGLNGNSVFWESINSGNNIGINYSAKLSVNELGYSNNARQANFDFGMQNYSINLESYYKTDVLQLLFGINFKQLSAITTQMINDKINESRNFYAQLDLFPQNNFTQSIGVYLTKNYHDISVKGFINNVWRLSSRQLLHSNVSFIQSNISEDNNFWFWYNRGYRFNILPAASIAIPKTFENSEVFTADIIYKYFIESASIEVGGSFRSFSNYYLEKQKFQYEQTNSTFNSFIEISPDENIKTAGAYIGINFKLSEKASAKIIYNHQRVLSGSNLFKQEWENYPENNITIGLFYQPFSNFGITTRLKYFSSMLWHNYEYVSYQSNDKYLMEVKPGLLAELSSNIWLWNKKIWINASLRNLFNEPEKYHPIGADLDLRMYLQSHFYFNSILE